MSKIVSKKQVVIFLVLLSALIALYYLSIYDRVTARKAPTLAASSLVNIDIQRFDQDLYEQKDSLSPLVIRQLEQKYGPFLKLYIEEIIAITSYRDPELILELTSFVQNPYIDTVYQDVLSKYEDISAMQAAFNSAFSYFYYYFPDADPYRIITFVSGFQFKNALMDSTLLIGLDLHLGREYDIYNKVSYLTNYLVRRLDETNMVPEAMKLLIEDLLPPVSSDGTLSSEIIKAGKVLYALHSILPEAPDSVVFSYTSEQTAWMKNNELNVWDYLLNEDLFYNTEAKTISRLMSDGPFTPGLPQESPPRAVSYIGMKIVEHYMNRFPEVSMVELFQTDPQEIVKKAKYKGKSRF